MRQFGEQRSRMTDAISSNCVAEATPPVGLDGKFRKIILVRGVIRLDNSSPVKLKPCSSLRIRGYRDCVHYRNDRLVDGKAGTWIDHFVTRVQIGVLRQADAGLGSGKNDHLFRHDVDSTAVTEVPGDGFAKGQNTLGIAVVSVAVVELTFDLLGDVLRQIKIRLAQIEFDDLRALRFEPCDMGPDLESVLGVDKSESF